MSAFQHIVWAHSRGDLNLLFHWERRDAACAVDLSVRSQANYYFQHASERSIIVYGYGCGGPIEHRPLILCCSFYLGALRRAIGKMQIPHFHPGSFMHMYGAGYNWDARVGSKYGNARLIKRHFLAKKRKCVYGGNCLFLNLDCYDCSPPWMAMCLVSQGVPRLLGSDRIAAAMLF